MWNSIAISSSGGLWRAFLWQALLRLQCGGFVNCNAKGLGDELGENTKTEVVLWTTAEKC